MLLQDVWFLEKLTHFDRAVIPERRMHAKGSGAYGAFTVTHDRPSSGIRPGQWGMPLKRLSSVTSATA